ncbi:hypothetical protein H0H92_011377 [Tricholoma furcatifolium]|nr:hypothetical protein H0H92_011377 [Tricholoma furcatifolium]
MASKPLPAPLSERSDIHKSCKSLETLLNVLNDYCEATGAIVLLQKKLAKALRETAAMKTTDEVPANALNASATIFEVSSDIYSKFAKISDKEYDAISSEVKKWFKKLTKEEKIHDERMANANAKIKQAGQAYEKKTKKNPHDATEEHARYLNIISALGPEISQENYYHSLNMTQRHAATTYSTAACLSRIADAEWLKTCEGTRRFAPTIGQLGEWRALCEGGWSGHIPPDLIGPDESQQVHQVFYEKQTGPVDFKTLEHPGSVNNSREFLGPTENSSPLLTGPVFELSKGQLIQSSSNGNSPSASSDVPNPFSTLAQTQNIPPQTALTTPFDISMKETNMDSVRSLSAFPLPPTHFPIPPRREQTSQSQSSQSSTSFPSGTRLTDSPLPDETDGTIEHVMAPPNPQSVPSLQPAPHSSVQQPEEKTLPKAAVLSSGTPVKDMGQLVQNLGPVSSLAAHGQLLNDQGGLQSIEDSFDRDFGGNAGNFTRSERTAGGSSGSIVATMRNKFSDNAIVTNPTSPSRAVRRLSGNVTDLATRFQTVESPSPPRMRSPSASRQLPVPPISPQFKDGDRRDNPLPESLTPGSPRQEEAARRRRQRMNDLAELELKEKELALRAREREVEQKTREFERERVRLDNVRERDEPDLTNDVLRGAHTQKTYQPIRERNISPRTQRIGFDAGDATALRSAQNTPRLKSSYSTSNLVPPSPSSNSVQHSHETQSSSHATRYSPSPTSSTQHLSLSSTSSASPHAPYCGCESCSAAKYRMPPQPPSPSSARPLAEPITLRPPEIQKKMGWMRRLSMPVGNAFSLDSTKKSVAAQNYAAGVGISSSHGRTGIFSLDGKRNASSTQLAVREDGRKSYDNTGIGHRSATNLGFGGGRRAT